MRRLRLIVLLALLPWAPALRAQDDPGTSDPQQQVLDRAVDLLEQGNDSGAIAELEQLRALENPSAMGLALLGALYVESGRPFDALDVLQPLADAEDADPAVLYNAGRAALATGNQERAARYFSRSVSLRPNTPAARELGLLYGAAGRYAEALTLLKPWAETDPEDREARMAAALCAIQLERAPDAEQLLSDLPQEEPRVRLLWGRLLLLKGDPWGAIGTLKPGLDDAPPEMEVDLRRALAQAYASVGQASSAVEVLSQIEVTDPSLALQLAQSQYQAGDLAGATSTLAPFAAALQEADRTSIPPAIGGKLALDYGRFLAMDGRYDEALTFLELASQLNPEEKQTWQLLGQTLAGLGRREEAQTALKKFQELSQQEVSASNRDRQMREELDDPALRALREVRSLMAEEKFDEALAVVRRERALNPGDVRAHLIEGQLLLVLGRHDEALAAADQALNLAPANPDCHYLRGTVRIAKGETRAAEADLRQALVLAPEHTAAMNDLAVLLIEAGQTDEARRLLQRVLEINPEDPVAAENLRGLGP